MPQLDYSFFPSQILWLLLSFTVLYLFLKHLMLPKIENIITNRLSIIEKDLKDAATLRDEATLLQQDINQKEQATHDYLAKMQADMLSTFASEKEEQIKTINKNSTESISNAVQEIDLALKEANKEIDHYVITHAQSLITTITGIKPSITDLDLSYNKMSKK